MLQTPHFALALSLLLTLAPAANVAAKPGPSFSRGFSSHAAGSHASTPHAAPTRPGGGFGSFGNAQAAPRQSDSALSQQLNKQSSQANALRTLDQRNAANAAQNAPQPAPGYGAAASPAPASAPGPTTVIVQQGGG